MKYKLLSPIKISDRLTIPQGQVLDPFKLKRPMTEAEVKEYAFYGVMVKTDEPLSSELPAIIAKAEEDAKAIAKLQAENEAKAREANLIKAKADAEEILKNDVDIEEMIEKVEIEEANVSNTRDTLKELTNRALKDMLTERGIKPDAQANKTKLIDLILGE